jgi:hypothetical protein
MQDANATLSEGSLLTPISLQIYMLGQAGEADGC